MALLDDIVNVKISIESGVANQDSFNNILLLGPAPADYDGDDIGIKPYSSIASVAEIWGTDDEVYKAATIAFANGAATLYIGVAGENIQDTLNEALDITGWYGLAVCGVADTEYETIATWADANSKLFAFTADCAEGIENPVTATHLYALGMATAAISENANNAYIGLAYLSQLLSNYEPGSETWAHKKLTSVSTDDWSESKRKDIMDAGLNFYAACAGANITFPGRTTDGEWIDVVRFRDWLVSEIQNNVFNVFVKNSKVPYTDAGINLVHTAVISALAEGQRVGGIAPTQFDEDGNEVPGYTTSVPRATSVSDGDKAERVLRNVTFTARLAGAIHMVEITGTLVE